MMQVQNIPTPLLFTCFLIQLLSINASIVADIEILQKRINGLYLYGTQFASRTKRKW